MKNNIAFNLHLKVGEGIDDFDFYQEGESSDIATELSFKMQEYPELRSLFLEACARDMYNNDEISEDDLDDMLYALSGDGAYDVVDMMSRGLN